jgi:aldo/keto reductase family protein
MRDAQACSARSYSVTHRAVAYLFMGERGEYYGGHCYYFGLIRPMQLATIVFHNVRKPELNKIAMGFLFHRLIILGRGVTDLDKQAVNAQRVLAERLLDRRVAQSFVLRGNAVARWRPFRAAPASSPVSIETRRGAELFWFVQKRFGFRLNRRKIPQFCGDENVFARDVSAGKSCLQRPAYLAFVPVSFRAIEVSKSGFQCVSGRVEAHPYLPETELLEYCKQKGIVFLAFAPLGHGMRPGPLEDAVVSAIAARVGKTPAQVLLAWAV